jgi:hypothetical protein
MPLLEISSAGDGSTGYIDKLPFGPKLKGITAEGILGPKERVDKREVYSCR